jgi:hypothetical protein
MDNNFRTELISPDDGQLLVVGSPAEAGRLRARGYRTRDELDERAASEARAAELAKAEESKPVELPQKPPRGAAAQKPVEA